MPFGRARPQPRIKRTMPQHEPIRPREGMDSDHLTMLKQLPCLICGSERKQMDPHHLMRGLPANERGMSRTASDQYAIPACRDCHREIHDDKQADDDAWLAARGIDGRGIARSLWTARGDEDALRRIVERSLLTRGVY
jgi:hypothetical protein